MNTIAFLDNASSINREEVSRLIALYLLGESQFQKILLRYSDLANNFDSVSFDDLHRYPQSPIWHFSSGVTPYRNYNDTSNIPIPIRNKLIGDFTKNVVTSFDFPIWFNMAHSAQKIMLVSQDPMPRALGWYADCRDAICSTAFGLHSKVWRENMNGGGRMWTLTKDLLSLNYGIYITDAHKFYFQSMRGKQIKATNEIIDIYKTMLISEIQMVQPSLIVALGKVSYEFLMTMESPRILQLPHFSARPIDTIKKQFSINGKLPIIEQAKLYRDAIINAL